MTLFHPVVEFQKLVGEMPEEFFTLYNMLKEKGVSHYVADKAAQEAWANGFKAKETE